MLENIKCEAMGTPGKDDGNTESVQTLWKPILYDILLLKICQHLRPKIFTPRCAPNRNIYTCLPNYMYKERLSFIA